MWIRSQDRKILATANNLYIRAIAKGYAICSDKCDLGKYSSEEKAMKVLDKIQMQIKYETSCVEKSNNGTYFSKADNVFDMPQDSDVKA